MHFIVVVSKASIFFWVGVCTSDMIAYGVGNLVQSVQYDKGLVFFMESNKKGINSSRKETWSDMIP